MPENWSEVVTFRNGNGEVIDYINKSTAEYKITDRSGATSEEIAKNAGVELSDEEVLSVLLHEFAHYVHYKHDKKLKSLDFAFDELTLPPY